MYSCELCSFNSYPILLGHSFFESKLLIYNVNHKCDNFNRFIRRFAIRGVLHSIHFQGFDQILQLRFYDLIYPVMRKLLWISSKTTSNLGPKPQTFIARAISCDKRKRYPAHQLLENTVIDLRDYLTISAFDKDSFVKLRRFVLFNHRAVNIGFTKIETKYIGQIFSPRITFVRIHGSQIDFPTLVKTVPYATYFSFISDLPKGWEKVLLNFKSKSMGPFFLTPKEITDFDSLHKFLTRQIPKFFLYLTDERNKFRTRKFYRYFQRELISGPKLRIDYKTKNGKDVSVKYSPKILT